MLHINSRQVDSHLWKIDVTDGVSVLWNATLNATRLSIYAGERDITPLNTAELANNSEAENLGMAVALVMNWVNFKNGVSTKRHPKWK